MNMETGNSTTRSDFLPGWRPMDGKLSICTRNRTDGGLKATVSKHDGNVWEDDAVEVYINPSYGAKSAARVYQFIINSNGTVYDQYVEPSIGQPPQVGWDCKGLEVKSETTGGEWVLMLAIPLEGTGGLATDKGWGLNICRDFQNPGELTCLTGANYQDYGGWCHAASRPMRRPWVWGYPAISKEGRLGASAVIRNLSAETRKYQVSLNVAGEGNPRKQRPPSHYTGAQCLRVRKRRCSGPGHGKGRIAIQVADSQGKVQLAEAIPFDRQEAEAADKTASATPVRLPNWRLEY